MPNLSNYVFVLWGDKFEEATATIFVTELRNAGFLVKLVGLTPPQIKGEHGLALAPDLMLDQALPLATNTICVVIPYPTRDIKWLKNDPRLSKFFYRAHSNKAKFVVGRLNGTDIADLELFPATDNVVVYTDKDNLIRFARELAALLSGEI